MSDLALKIYKEGYDARFQATQAIPVFINELIVRVIYSIRRMIRYYSTVKKEERNIKALWRSCEPFKNATVKRMLTVAHGTFCLIDIGDATVRGFASGNGIFNFERFFMRLNIVGVGRFAISLYGEIGRKGERKQVQEEAYYYRRKRVIVDDYIAGLKILSEAYDDEKLLTFIDDLKESDSYKKAFAKTVELAEKRHVDEKDILRSKTDIDAYFGGR